LQTKKINLPLNSTFKDRPQKRDIPKTYKPDYIPLFIFKQAFYLKNNSKKIKNKKRGLKNGI